MTVLQQKVCALEISSAPAAFIPNAQFVESRVTTTSRKTELNASDLEAHRSTIAKLRTRDREVRAHEQAHASAAGGLTKGGASFTYERGPDGRQYAVSGEVNIDTSPVAGDPEATLRKARQIRAAALAPADPSSQDRAVASSATAMEAQARQELQEKKNDGQEKGTGIPARSNSPQIDLFV